MGGRWPFVVCTALRFEAPLEREETAECHLWFVVCFRISNGSLSKEITSLVTNPLAFRILLHGEASLPEHRHPPAGEQSYSYVGIYFPVF